MRRTWLLVALLLCAWPVQAESDTLTLTSEAAPGPVLLWDANGTLIEVDPDQPLNLSLPSGDYTLVRFIDGVPQLDRLQFSETTDATAFLNQSFTPLAIGGGAHLDILGPIAASTSLNATWSSTVEVPNTLGHPALADAHLGVDHQIQTHFEGNQTAFHAWVGENLSLGCCAYDRSEMSANLSHAVWSTDETWGWDLTATLKGMGDGRSTRLLWVPITGGLGDMTDLRITLPVPHELRYSPQQDHISGVPDDFTLHRGAIGVTGNVTLALGTNDAPTAAISATDRTLPWLPANRPSLLHADCEDNSISEPTPRFILRDGNQTLLDENTSTLPIDPFFLGIGPGWYNISLACEDPQGAIGTYEDALYLDGSAPTRILRMEYLADGETTPVTVDHGQAEITVPAGATLSAAVQAGDDAFAPVHIEWTSDKTEGWRHEGSGQHSWSAIFIQGDHINGQHMVGEERHQAREPTVWHLQLNLTDAAGNDAIQIWEVHVSDATAPHPRPALSVDGNHYGEYNHPEEGGAPLVVNLSSSWDDLDAITSLTWEFRLNGAPLHVADHWNDLRTFELPPMETGRHVLTVNATDSAGNTGTHSSMFLVEPVTGVFYSVTEVTLVGEGGPGEPGALDVSLENAGRGPSAFQLCYLDQCTELLQGVEATADGPGRMTHRIAVPELGAGEVKIEIRFDDGSSEMHETDLVLQSEMTPLMWILLCMPAILGLLAFWRLKQTAAKDEDEAA